jgi:hypothetical protein
MELVKLYRAEGKSLRKIAIILEIKRLTMMRYLVIVVNYSAHKRKKLSLQVDTHC